MQSEYATKYSTKSDAINLNGPLLQVADLLADKTLPPERKSKVVLSKMQNLVNKAIVYPLVMLASYLSGHGDSWFPLKTQKHDARLFQRALRLHGTAYDNDDMDCVIDTARPLSENGEEASDTDQDREEFGDWPHLMDEDDLDPSRPSSLRALDPVSIYEARDEALKHWSPFEMTMAFQCTKATTRDSDLLKLNESAGAPNYGHKPFKNKSGKPSIRVPQFYTEPPIRPDESAPLRVKEEYAAFVLGNFTPYDKSLSSLPGESLWTKLQYWETHPPEVKEGDPVSQELKQRHEFAKMVISNYQTRAEARLAMREENKRIAVQRRFVVAAAGLNNTHEDPVMVS